WRNARARQTEVSTAAHAARLGFPRTPRDSRSSRAAPLQHRVSAKNPPDLSSTRSTATPQSSVHPAGAPVVDSKDSCHYPWETLRARTDQQANARSPLPALRETSESQI